MNQNKTKLSKHEDKVIDEVVRLTMEIVGYVWGIETINAINGGPQWSQEQIKSFNNMSVIARDESINKVRKLLKKAIQSHNKELMEKIKDMRPATSTPEHTAVNRFIDDLLNLFQSNTEGK